MCAHPDMNGAVHRLEVPTGRGGEVVLIDTHLKPERKLVLYAVGDHGWTSVDLGYYPARRLMNALADAAHGIED